MRVALISDIHGNALALELVLADIRREAVDLTVCLGDVATLGPKPRECLEMVRSEGIRSIMGNHDEFLLDQPRVTLLRAAFLVTPGSPAASFWSSSSVPHRGDRPLRGVGRGLSTSVGDAVPVAAPPRCNIYSMQEGRFLTRWSMPD